VQYIVKNNYSALQNIKACLVFMCTDYGHYRRTSLSGDIYFYLKGQIRSQQTLPCKSEYNLPQIIRHFNINCFP